MSEVTVICCWNNERQYNDFVSTLKTQDYPCELIGIDNRGNKAFTSCAAALNSVIDDVKTEYIIYSHQDILLLDSECLSKFVNFLKGLGRDDILGVTGTRFDTYGSFADFQHYNKHSKRFEPAYDHRLTEDIMELDIVDECFFGGHTEHFREYPFDEVTCDNWHLYAADACLQTKLNGVRGGGHVFICRMNMRHLSHGDTYINFIRNFYNFARKYSQNYSFIRTPCAWSKTDRFHLVLYAIKTFVRRSMVITIAQIGLYNILRKLIKGK